MVLLGAACAENVDVSAPPKRTSPTLSWKALLGRAAGPDGVDYDRIAEKHDVLLRFLSWCGDHGPDSDDMRESAEDRRIAFLVNAYNAAVIEGVLRNRPLSSVHDVRIGIYPSGGAGFFWGQRFRVDQEWVDLYHLEHEYIVARYQEPLVHVMLNCGAQSCPPVQWWDNDHLQDDMEAALRTWLQTGGAMVPDGDGWAVNEIFWWYRDDFLDWSDATSLCDWLAPYTSGSRHDWLTRHQSDCPLGRIPYDRSLDERTDHQE